MHGNVHLDTHHRRRTPNRPLSAPHVSRLGSDRHDGSAPVDLDEALLIHGSLSPHEVVGGQESDGREEGKDAVAWKEAAVQAAEAQVGESRDQEGKEVEGEGGAVAGEGVEGSSVGGREGSPEKKGRQEGKGERLKSPARKRGAGDKGKGAGSPSRVGAEHHMYPRLAVVGHTPNRSGAGERVTSARSAVESIDSPGGGASPRGPSVDWEDEERRGEGSVSEREGSGGGDGGMESLGQGELSTVVEERRGGEDDEDDWEADEDAEGLGEARDGGDGSSEADGGKEQANDLHPGVDGDKDGSRGHANDKSEEHRKDESTSHDEERVEGRCARTRAEDGHTLVMRQISRVGQRGTVERSPSRAGRGESSVRKAEVGEELRMPPGCRDGGRASVQRWTDKVASPTG